MKETVIQKAKQSATASSIYLVIGGSLFGVGMSILGREQDPTIVGIFLFCVGGAIVAFAVRKLLSALNILAP
jgi:hypothetical protein